MTPLRPIACAFLTLIILALAGVGPFLIVALVSKINQGSCLGCLVGDDAPAIRYVFYYLAKWLECCVGRVACRQQVCIQATDQGCTHS